MLIILKLMLSIFSALILIGCSVAPTQSGLKSSPLVFNSQFDLQTQLLEDAHADFGEKNQLLRLLHLCSISHYAKYFNQSNQNCQSAEILLKHLQTESISENLHALFTNSNAKAYRGGMFEEQLLYALGMINYAALHDQSEALVESRKLDIATQSHVNRKITQEESLGRYLSALLYESEGQIDSALIDYRIAFHGYLQTNEKLGLPFPSMISNDLMRAFQKMDMKNEYERYRKKYSLPGPRKSLSNNSGEIVLIVENGYAPYRATEYFDDDGQLVAIGVYKKRSPMVHKIVGKVLGKGKKFPATTVYNSALSIKHNQEKAIHKTILADELRFVANREFKRFGGDFSNKDPAVSAEHSDARSWSTLPGSVSLLRKTLPAGKHTLAVKYYSYYGDEVYKQLFSNINVFPNKRTFLYAKMP